MDKSYLYKHRTYHLLCARRWDELFKVVEDPEWRNNSLEVDPRGIFNSIDLDRAFEAALKLNLDGIAPLCALSLLIPESIIGSFGGLSIEGLFTLILLNPDLKNHIIRYISKTMDCTELLKVRANLAYTFSEVGLSANAREEALFVVESIKNIKEESLQLYLHMKMGIVLTRIGDLDSAQNIQKQIYQRLDLFETQSQTEFIQMQNKIWFFLLKDQLGDQHKARFELRSILNSLQCMSPDMINIEYLQLICDTIIALCKVGDYAYARNAIEQISFPILNSNPKILDNGLDFIYRLVTITRLFYTADFDKKHEAYTRLMKISQKFVKNWLVDKSDKVKALCSVALVMAITGYYLEADKCIREAIKFALTGDPDRTLHQLEQVYGALIPEFMGLIAQGGLRPGKVSDLDTFSIFTRHSIGGRHQERAVKIMTLCRFGMVLGRCGLFDSTLQLSCWLLGLSNYLQHKPEGLFARLLGTVFPGSHPWFFVYCRLLDFLLDTGDHRLVQLAMDLINSHTRAEKTLRATCKQLARSHNPPKNYWHFPKLHGLIRTQPVPLITSWLIENGLHSEAIQFIKQNSRICLADTAPKKWIEMLASQGHLEDAIFLANRKASMLSDFIAACLILPSVSFALLWLRLSHTSYMLNCCLVFSILGFLYGCYYLYIGRFSQSNTGWSKSIRGVENDEIIAYMKGAIQGNNLERVEHLFEKLSLSKFIKARVYPIIAQSLSPNKDVSKSKRLLLDASRIVLDGKFEQLEQVELIGGICEAFIALPQSDAKELGALIQEFLKIAKQLHNPKHRLEVLTFLNCVLQHSGELILYNEVLEEIEAIVSVNTKDQRTVINILIQLNCPTTLIDLWKKNSNFWTANNTLRNAAIILLVKNNMKEFDSMIPILQKELLSENYAEFILDCLDTLTARADLDKAKELLQNNIAAVAMNLPPKRLPNFGQLANKLGFASVALQELSVKLQKCKIPTDNDDFTLPQRLFLLGNIGQAFAELKSDEAKELALDSLRLLFTQSRGNRLPGFSWYPLWNAVSVLAYVDDKTLLAESWIHISRLFNESFFYNNY